MASSTPLRSLRRLRRLAFALCLALVPWAGASADDGSEADPDRWVQGMVSALRPGDTLGAHFEAWTKDETGSERNFSIEMIRRHEPGRLVAVVEMREEKTPDPIVLKIDSPDGGDLAIWTWDVRFQRFVRILGLEGTETFAGTHFRYEDLGFTDLRERKGGTMERVEKKGQELVELTSPAYYYYGRVVTRLDPTTLLPRKIVIYDNTNARIRELIYDRVEPVGGRPYPRRMRFRDGVTGSESRIMVESLTLGAPLRGEDFDLEELERRIQAGEEPVQLRGQGNGA